MQSQGEIYLRCECRISDSESSVLADILGVMSMKMCHSELLL